MSIGSRLIDLGFIYHSSSVPFSTAMLKWCSDNFGRSGQDYNWFWTSGSDYIPDGGDILVYFKNIDDQILFQLTWE